MFKSAVVIAAVAATSTVSGYAVYPQLCGAPELLKLSGVLFTNGADLTECQANSQGWQFIPPTAPPTVAQETSMCQNAGCKKLLAGIKKLNPTDCFLSINNTAVGVNVKQLSDEFEPFCELLGL
jgi:hypothetical protein